MKNIIQGPAIMSARKSNTFLVSKTRTAWVSVHWENQGSE